MGAKFYKNTENCVASIIDKIGYEIVIATPLGLGKPVRLLNAFYKHAKNNPKIKLKILTALSLIKPTVTNALAQRLVEPILERRYSKYIDLDYEVDRRAQNLPDNVQIIEFYLATSEYLDNHKAQQDYICSNYTHVIRDICYYNVNVIAQLIACKMEDLSQFSLSCNSDITFDLIRTLRDINNVKFQFIGEINYELPYMYGESAVLNKDQFDAILMPTYSSQLFVLPRPALTEQDFMIGLYSSTLIKDDSCIQIGIGSLSEALIFNLILRHESNSDYIHFLKHINANKKFSSLINKLGDTSEFQKGLFASTEILVDGFLDLYNHNILKKWVYDDIILQKLLNENQITEEVTEHTLELLLQHNRVSSNISFEEFKYLQYYGVFKDQSKLAYKDRHIYFSTGMKVKADLNNRKAKAIILQHCLGNKLISFMQDFLLAHKCYIKLYLL